MSNLKDLFISQSFYGIVNLEDSTSPLTSQSGDLELQDGIGDNLGLRINATTKEFTVVNNFKVDGNADFNGDVDISGSVVHSGSLDVHGNITAHTGSFDTINTRILHVTLESSSVIFSSGSNQLGDEITDVQELIGQVTISGSLGVDGDSSITGSLTVSNEISSSTINGIGNVTQYSQSVHDEQVAQNNRLSQLEADSGSQDSRLDNLELFTSSQESINSGYNTFTSSYYVDSASFDLRLDDLEAFSSSLVADFVTEAEFNPYTQSVEIRLNNLELETSSIDNRLNNIELETASLQTEIDGLSAQTSSYARLDVDNTFENNNFFSGSVRGSVYNIPIVSSTASIDCSQGNFFTLAQNTSSDTLLNATNITGGRTITLRVTKTNPNATITIDTGSIKMPFGFSYSITTGDEKEDVLTFVSFDTGSIYGVASKNFV